MNGFTNAVAVSLLAIAISACGSAPSISNVEPAGDSSEIAEEAPSEPITSAAEENATLEGAEPINAPETASSTSPGTEVAALPISIDTFTMDELFEAGGGGCGMTLWQPETDPWDDGALFFHGLEEDMAFMMFDNTLTQLSRTAASGDDFYGQQTNQTFETGDGTITVQVDAALGNPGEIESVRIPDAMLTIETQGQTETIAVVGDAGC